MVRNFHFRNKKIIAINSLIQHYVFVDLIRWGNLRRTYRICKSNCKFKYELI